MRPCSPRPWRNRPLPWLAALSAALLLGAPLAAQEPKKDAPKPPAKEQPGQDGPVLPGLEDLGKLLDDLPPAAREALKNLPFDVTDFLKNLKDLPKALPGGGFNPQDFDDLRKELQKAREEIRKALEERRKARGLPDRPGRLPGRAGRGGDARLGVGVAPPDEALADQLNLPRGQGLVIFQVREDSPATKAGLKPNDVLLKLDGKPVPSDPEEFRRLIDGLKADSALEAVILRKGKQETIKGLTLPAARKPAPPRRGPEILRDGLRLAPEFVAGRASPDARPVMARQVARLD